MAVSGNVATSDSSLLLILTAFDHLIEQARASLESGLVNVFDQHKIASFYRNRTFERPLTFKLQSGTYRKYKGIWKRLLCFIYRLVHQRQTPSLPFQLTSGQASAFQLLVEAADQAANQEALYRGLDPSNRAMQEEANQRLNSACLNLCIELLDHPLYGNIYDSIVISFLAVLGVNVEANSFYTAAQFTSHLSAFIKMAQMLVI